VGWLKDGFFVMKNGIPPKAHMDLKSEAKWFGGNLESASLTMIENNILCCYDL
jgi:hypothetical protein